MSETLERLHFQVSDDRLSVQMSITGHALPEDAHLDYDETFKYLTEEHKYVGVKEDALREFVDELNANPIDFRGGDIIAEGKAAQKGQDGSLIWCIERDKEPEVDEHGRVDFYSICNLRNAREGDAIARIKPAIQGEDGFTVTGESLVAEPVKDVEFVAGENVEYIEDIKEFRALLNGRVELRGNAICVSDVYDVDGDVDFNIGHINFSGFVRIKGDVQENFRVVAGKGIQVDGNVDGAVLESGGTITVLGGINGRNKGSIECDSDLVAPFIRNCELVVGGALIVQRELVNCSVRAGKLVCEEAHLEGGEATATGNIDVSDAGSKASVKTILHAGYDYFLDQAVEEAEKSLAPKKSLEEKIREKIEVAHKGFKLLPKPSRTALEEGMTNLLNYLDELVTYVEATTDKIESDRKRVRSRNREVIIRKKVYPGVTVRIGKYDRAIDKEYEGFRRFAFDPKRFEIAPFYDQTPTGKPA